MNQGLHSRNFLGKSQEDFFLGKPSENIKQSTNLELGNNDAITIVIRPNT